LRLYCAIHHEPSRPLQGLRKTFNPRIGQLSPPRALTTPDSDQGAVVTERRITSGPSQPVPTGGFEGQAPGRRRLVRWLNCVAFAVGFFAALTVTLHAVSWLVPAAVHATPQLRVLASVTAIAVAEFGTLFALSYFLRRHGRTFASVGWWRRATPGSWVLAIGIAVLSVAPEAAGMVSARLGISIWAVLFQPSFFHVYTALVAGFTGGICEEVLFRGFMMTELAEAGHSKTVQVVATGILFGCAHLGFVLRLGWASGLGIAVPAAILGMLYSLVFLAGRRSVMPSALSHFLNDAILVPWVFLLIFRTPVH
jgi:CAAX protease family protein